MASDPTQAGPANPVATPPRVCDKVRIRFRKSGDLRLVSHRDLMKCFERILRRAALPIHVSQGFHPMPRMVFGMPLALFPAMSDRLGGPSILGLLYAAPAVGALGASLTSRWVPYVQRHGLAVLVAATVWGIAIIGFGSCETLWPALACLALAALRTASAGSSG